jgi:hypothetical protein
MKPDNKLMPPFYRWENLEKQRYYIAYINQDLWGNWLVSCSWGGKNRAGGRVNHLMGSSYRDAIDCLALIHKKRLKHGYTAVGQPIFP